MSQQVTPFELLGGETALFRLVERFYALMDSEPEFHAVRAQACMRHARARSCARTRALPKGARVQQHARSPR